MPDQREAGQNVRLRARWKAAAVAAALSLWATQAPAATYVWVGGNSGDPTNYNDANNWSPNTAAPGASDLADFNGNATTAPVNTTPTLTASTSVGELEFDTSGWMLGGSPNVLTLEGIGGIGIFNNINSGTNEISAALDIGAAQNWYAVTGGTLQIDGIISDSNALTIGSAAYGGTVIMTAANTFSGPLNINGGTVQLSAGGTLASVGTITFNRGGTLLVDNLSAAGGNANNRINSATNFQFSGGSFVYQGSDTTSSSGGVSSAILEPGPVSDLTVTSNGNSATFTLGSLSRATGGGVLLVNGAGLGTVGGAQLLVTNAPPLIGTTAGKGSDNSGVYNTQIVPFLVGESSGGAGTATGTPNTFISYDSTNGTGLRPLNPADEFSSSVVAGDNVYISAASTSSANTAINSLVINGGNLTINDGTTLTDSSGALLFVSSNSINPSSSSGTFNFGSQEGIVTVNSGVTGTVAAPIAGSNALTVNGVGTLNLAASSSAFTGAVYVNGTLQMGNGAVASSDGNLPNAGSFNVSNDGALIFNDVSPLALSTPISYTPFSGGSITGIASVTFAGSPGAVTVNSTVNLPEVYISGPVNVNSSITATSQFFTGYSATLSSAASTTYSSVVIGAGASVTTPAAYLAFNSTSSGTQYSYLKVTNGGAFTVQSPTGGSTVAPFYAANYGDSLIEVGTLNGSPSTTSTINYATNTTYAPTGNSANAPNIYVNGGTNSGGSYNTSQFSEINLYAGGVLNIGNQTGISGAGPSGNAGLTAGFAQGQTFVLNIDGGTLSNMFGNGPIDVVNTSAAGNTTYGVVNLLKDGNGNVGKLITGYLRALPGSAGGALDAFLNFNGGELEYNDIPQTGNPSSGTAGGASTSTFINAGYDGGIYVFPAGAIIGTNGNPVAGATGGTITIPHPLLAPTGYGITTIPISNGGSGYVSPPLVQITGGSGNDATAVAILTNGVVTGFTITSQGVNYSASDQPTVTLIGGDPTTPATVGSFSSADFTQNVSTGGLTKVDTGTLTLNGGTVGTSTTTVANTYAGPTTVVAGTLILGGSLANATDAAIIETNTTANAAALQFGNSSNFNTIPNAKTILVGDVAPGAGQVAGALKFPSKMTLASGQTIGGFGSIGSSNTTTTYGFVIGNGATIAPGTENATGSATLPAPVYYSTAGVTGTTNTTGNQTPFNTIEGNATGTATGALTLTYSPGANAMITTWTGGGTYYWKLNLATGGSGATNSPGTVTATDVSGTNWDAVVMKSLLMSASTSNAFTIQAVGFGTGNTGSTTAVNIGNGYTQQYSWTIAQFTSGGSGGSSNATILADLSLNVSGLPAAATGYKYYLSEVSDTSVSGDEDLVINYAPAPEPTALCLLAPAAGALMLRRRRRSDPGAN